MNLNTELQNFSQELENALSNKGELIQAALVDIERKCFLKAGNNDTTFVDCMYYAADNVENEERNLGLRTAFFQAQTAECLINSDNSSDAIRKCRENGITGIRNSFEKFISNIKF